MAPTTQHLSKCKNKQRQRRDEEEENRKKKLKSKTPIPISLGKPSLRQRLEAYYSLINPESISDASEWTTKFDIIYEKYGGSIDGERKLERKLAKKYGGTVRLLVCNEDKVSGKNRTTLPPTGGNDDKHSCKKERHPEEWFELTELERQSGVHDFTSNRFDPVSALQIPEQQYIKSYPFIADAPILDNLSKVRFLLPDFDPQSLERTISAKPKTKKSIPTKIPVFTSLASKHVKGPLSVLYRAHTDQTRVRVFIRYVDCMRGIFTGKLLAFDKHFNMILKDAEEIYSPRLTRWLLHHDENVPEEEEKHLDWSNMEIELYRRKQMTTQKLFGKRRCCKQILIRGDNVVSVWRADEETSKWSRGTDAIGTPGSCLDDNAKRKT